MNFSAGIHHQEHRSQCPEEQRMLSPGRNLNTGEGQNCMEYPWTRAFVHLFANSSVDNLHPKNQALQNQSGIVKAALPMTWWNLRLMNTGKPECADLVYAFYPIYCLWLNGALPHAPSPFFISLLPQQTLNLLMVMEKKRTKIHLTSRNSLVPGAEKDNTRFFMWS